ncbi:MULTISPECIES: hypothetical protein [unclassified Streptomyces]|uniref:hypothetical protein n=1 Tax=unclassified Streptomyces TaxID=2593676 RepID=UPI0033264A93
MTVDPTDPETFTAADESTDLDPEAPEADAAEQHAELTPRDDTLRAAGDSPDADEADLAEQARVVELDEDDYR